MKSNLIKHNSNQHLFGRQCCCCCCFFFGYFWVNVNQMKHFFCQFHLIEVHAPVILQIQSYFINWPFVQQSRDFERCAHSIRFVFCSDAIVFFSLFWLILKGCANWAFFVSKGKRKNGKLFKIFKANTSILLYTLMLIMSTPIFVYMAHGDWAFINTNTNSITCAMWSQNVTIQQQ